MDEKSSAKESCLSLGSGKGSSGREGSLDDEHEATPNNLDLASHSLPQNEFETVHSALCSLCCSPHLHLRNCHHYHHRNSLGWLQDY